MPDRLSSLSPNRRQMLRNVRFSRVTRTYNIVSGLVYQLDGERIDGWGANALNWLEANRFIRAVSEPETSINQRLMEATAQGVLWLEQNGVRG